MEHIPIVHLLCVTIYSKCWGFSEAQDKNFTLLVKIKILNKYINNVTSWICVKETKSDVVKEWAESIVGGFEVDWVVRMVSLKK